MKKLTFLLFLLLTSLTMMAQDIVGQWNGLLKVPGAQLRLVFHIAQTPSGYTATMDSPDQGAKGIPTTSTTFENKILKIRIANAGIDYEGTLGDDQTISGTFKQAGQSFPMSLSKAALEKPVTRRPQEPVKPYPYYEEEVRFVNTQAGIRLAGTLTLPKKEGVYPAVVLISGSGPQNRDEELMGHKPFLVLADYLTRNGIGVLRFDDRGTAASEGDFSTATSADFATDVEAAVAYLQSRKEINPKQIGLVGHSEGGIIAPMVASRSKDVAFLVLLAGSGLQGKELLLLQQQLIGKAMGMSESDINKVGQFNKAVYEKVIQLHEEEQLKADLKVLLKKELQTQTVLRVPEGMTADEFIAVQINQVTNPWMRYFIRHDPATTLSKVKCPVLALNGEKDLQVAPKENLAAIRTLLQKAGNKHVTTKELPGLNHLFQEAETGAPSEYSTIEQTFSPVALEEILKWLQQQVK